MDACGEISYLTLGYPFGRRDDARRRKESRATAGESSVDPEALELDDSIKVRPGRPFPLSVSLLSASRRTRASHAPPQAVGMSLNLGGFRLTRDIWGMIFPHILRGRWTGKAVAASTAGPDAKHGD